MSFKKLGLSILMLGVLLLIGTGLYKFFQEVNIPLVIKLGLTGVILGILILLISLIIERWEDNKNDNS
jgi:hypothetical protein